MTSTRIFPSIPARVSRGRWLAPLAAAIMVVAAIAPARAFVLNFDDNEDIGDIVHGQVIDSEFTLANGGVPGTGGLLGVSVGATNNGGGPNLAVAFDSARTHTRDHDLEDPFKIAPGSEPYIGDLRRPGNILIVQENNWGCADGVCNEPDDEAGGPNSMEFLFSENVTLTRIDLFDIDCKKVWNGWKWVEDCGWPGGESATIEFFSDAAMQNSLGTAAVSSFGNHTAKRVFFGDNGQSNVRKLVVTLSGSGAIGNIAGIIPDNQQVPEPASLGLVVAGLIGLGIARRRRRAKARAWA